MTANHKDGYRVICSSQILKQIRHLAERAKDLGILNLFLDAINTINARLKSDPLAWGDPQYHFHHLNLLMCQSIYGMLRVNYGVHQEKRLVFIKEIKPLPNHPLSQE